MWVSVHLSENDTDGEMFLVQAQPASLNQYRLGITAAPGPNGGASVVEVPADSPATKMWLPTQTEKNITLEAGDEIMSVNGVASSNSNAVIQGLAKSKNGVATLKVLIVRTGNTETFYVEPGRVNLGPTVHYVIAGQSAAGNDTFDYGIVLDMEHLDMLTRHIRHELVGSSVILRGNRCTAAEIKNAITSINANPGDTIFIYFSGHGAYDASGHFFTLDGPHLYRKDIRKILQQKNVRLSVFVSDACNADSTPLPDHIARPAGATEFTTNGLTKFESLLLNHRGTIELNAADKNQYGWSNTIVGGYFSSNLPST